MSPKNPTLVVDRKALLEEMDLLTLVTVRKSAIPILSHVLIRSNGEALEISATDLDVSLVTTCPTQGSGEVHVAVQGAKLREALAAFPADELELEQEEERLLLWAGSTSAQIPGLPAIDFPNLPNPPDSDEEFAIPLEDLQGLIHATVYAVNAEESRFSIQGASFEALDGSLRIVATDAHQLSTASTEVSGLTSRNGVIVPKKCLQEILKLKGKGLAYWSFPGEFLRLRSGQRELYARLLEGVFPDTQRILDRKPSTGFSCRRDDLITAVRLAGLFAGMRSECLKFEVQGDSLIIAANSEFGAASETLDIERDAKCPDLAVGLNAKYLRNIVSSISSDRVRFLVSSIDHPVFASPNDDPEHRVGLVMPMRI